MKVKPDTCPECGRKGIQHKHRVSVTKKGTTHTIKRCQHCRREL